jgi:hypothetical protein
MQQRGPAAGVGRDDIGRARLDGQVGAAVLDVAARLADLPPRLTRETRSIDAGARLSLAPCVKQLLAPTADRLEELADGAKFLHDHRLAEGAGQLAGDGGRVALPDGSSPMG